ncbi:PAS domain S-box protein [Rhodanobacter caeni]|uniref:histidine kinase n=1 Tax=Rhodanobacter caeni TaxID=657654 RepID=A0ABN0UH28_9GAMM
MADARRHLRFPVTGALLVPALALLHACSVALAGAFSMEQVALDALLAVLACSAWSTARGHRRVGLVLALCAAAWAAAQIRTGHVPDARAPLWYAAMLVLPAAICAGITTSAALRATARGIALATTFAGLAYLLRAWTAPHAPIDLLLGALQTLALSCGGWLFASLLEEPVRPPTLAPAALSGLGWMGLLGWMLQAAVLVQGGTLLVPMAFNTALAFVLLGHALWLLGSGRTLAAWCLGLLCVPLAVSPLLAEYLDRMDVVGELLWRQQAIQAEHAIPGRLAPNTALSLLLATGGLTCALFARRNSAWWSATWACGLLVSLAGVLALVGYVFALPGMRTLGPHTPMSLPVALGMLMLGIGLATSNPRPPSQHRYRAVVFPAVICLLTVASSLLLWRSLEQQQRRLEWDALQGRRDNVANLLQEGMNSRMEAFERLASRLATTPASLREPLFAHDAANYLRDMDGLRAVGYADATHVMRQTLVRPATSGPPSAGALFAPARIFDQVDAEGDTVLSAPLTLLNGKQGQLIVAPVRDGGANQGYVVAAFQFDRLFPRLLEAMPELHGLLITQHGQVLYAQGEHGTTQTPASMDMQLAGQWLSVNVYPGPGGEHGRIPQLVLLLGFALGGLLAVALRLSALARERTRRAEADSARLAEQGRELERALEASRLMMDSAPDVICVLDREGRFLQLSAAAQRRWGFAPGSLLGKPLTHVVHPDDRESTVAAATQVLQGVPNPNVRNRIVSHDGRVLYMQWSAVWSEPSQCMYVVGRDLTELHRAEDLEQRQRQILTAIARGDALPQVLESIVTAYETAHRDAICSILLLRDGSLHHGAAPRLPADYCRGIDGSAIGPAAGSCGTAAWRGERVVVTDIANDPLWHDYAPLALAHGLHACWSTPVLARNGAVLGTFAVYHNAPHDPSAAEISGIDTLAALTGVAIEHAHAFTRLSESEQRFRSLFEHHPDGVLALDLDGRVVSRNPAANALLGLDRPQRLAFVHSFAPVDGARVQAALDSATRGESARLDVAALDANDQRFAAHLVNIPIIVQGEPRGVFAVLQDHRELRHAQQALAGQLALIYAIAESVGEGLVAVDADGQPTFLNRTASRTLKLAPERLPTSDELPDGMRETLQKILAGVAHASDDDAAFRLVDGSLLDVAYLATPLITRDQLAGAVMAFRDIGGVKAARRVLQQRNQFFEMSQEVFCIADPVSGMFLQANPAYARLLGLDEAQMLAIPFIDLLHPLDKAPTQLAIQRQIDGVESIDGLLTRMRCADGSYRWLEWVSISGADGLLYGAARDVTARHQADVALARAMDDLRIRNRELQDFAYVASHDLQEPLRKIQSFSDRLLSRLSGTLDESSSDYLQRMGHAAHRMQALIDDLLAYSRVATRNVAVSAVDLSDTLKAVMDDLETRIAEAGAVIEAGTLPVIQADPTQMRQLLQNLLANALKFRAADRPCRISVTATRIEHADAAGAARWELRVTDNGIGFESSYAERIFAPFQRLHPRNVYEGTGIGLAIVRRIVERHGGSVRAEAQAGQGASFIVMLPGSASTPEPADPQDASFIDGKFLGVDS